MTRSRAEEATNSRRHEIAERGRGSSDGDAREQLLAALPVTTDLTGHDASEVADDTPLSSWRGICGRCAPRSVIQDRWSKE
jgi:hypothetical protein